MMQNKIHKMGKVQFLLQKEEKTAGTKSADDLHVLKFKDTDSEMVGMETPIINCVIVSPGCCEDVHIEYTRTYK